MDYKIMRSVEIVKHDGQQREYFVEVERLSKNNSCPRATSATFPR